MPWIKRNIFFVAGGLVALVLMGVAGYFLFSNLSRDAAVTEELNQQIQELRRISEADPHPGTEEVDNISAARKEQQRLEEFLADARKLFVPVPTYEKTDDQGFNNLLGNTIYQLQTTASNAGVVLPPDYSFTFQAQRGRLSFDRESIEPLMAQLGEVKTICNILFEAKVNSLEGMRRVPVSTNDPAGTADYLNATLVTNDISIVAPYEVTFRSFSDELGEVMNGILRSTNCLIVKSLTVEQSLAGPGGDPNAALGGSYYPPTTGIPGGGRYGGFDERYGAPRAFPQPSVPGRPVARSTTPQVFLSEKPLRITLLIDVVKIKPRP